MATQMIGLVLFLSFPHHGNHLLDWHSRRVPGAVGRIAFHRLQPSKTMSNLLLHEIYLVQAAILLQMFI